MTTRRFPRGYRQTSDYRISELQQKQRQMIKKGRIILQLQLSKVACVQTDYLITH